ncbi:hypothetical protein Cyagr_0177 [Cyanobium gracile PCC 6307]|uniref:Uncharacterized protein n=1 Tax=Cyanobium gracile (strain ATCC 27147 / PCC 6307) TaxID=292564 RepID=K9P4B7_CYAGP|nr:hypothetical protein Cyagr_0177 [Cyanobium gracile PCC 6307]
MLVCLTHESSVRGGKGWSQLDPIDLGHEHLQALGATPGLPLLDRPASLSRVRTGRVRAETIFVLGIRCDD